MIRYITIATLILFTSACSYKLKDGLYRYENDSEFSIKANNQYEYQRLDRSRPFAFSQGSYSIEKKKIRFYPDSSYLFQIKAADAYFDSSLKQKIKINIQADSINDLKFYFTNWNGDTLFFDKDLSKTFEMSEFQRTQIAIWAGLNDGEKKNYPGPINTSIVSNVIFFNDISYDFNKWNVLKLNLYLKPRMFAFVRLGNYILYKGKLIKEGWPVYHYNKRVKKMD